VRTEQVQSGATLAVLLSTAASMPVSTSHCLGAPPRSLVCLQRMHCRVLVAVRHRIFATPCRPLAALTAAGWQWAR
jgi:hypothetical protein